MTDNDLLADGENIVADAGELGGSTLVVRISRTAAGTRTWTVGATAPLADVDGDGALVARLLAVDDALALLDSRSGPDTTVIDGDTTLTRQLQQSLIHAVLRKAGEWHPASGEDKPDGWLTSAAIVEAVGGSRSRVVADLQAMVRAGMIEYRPGGGRNKPSLYRLAVTPARPVLVKGAKA